jgi:hypothetical protein
MNKCRICGAPCGNGGLCASCKATQKLHDDALSGTGMSFEMHDDALCAAACAACKRVNPDNPLAVAEHIDMLFSAARQASRAFEHGQDGKGKNIALIEIGEIVDRAMRKDNK